MRVFLGIGSNLGARLENLQAAVDLLDASPEIRVVASSRVWETDPVGGPPQPDFLNVVVQAESDLAPFDLLAATQAVERLLGRVRDVRWGPRTVDIDIELIDDLEIDEAPDLEVPHPRMTERAFVLFPLLDLDREVALPDGTRLVDVRLGPGAAAGARPYAPPLVVGR
jgi:2-amino-4-hydroxy-6-hydroxymethyldihydropteridine diphosphokinase